MSVWNTNSLEHLKECSKQVDNTPKQQISTPQKTIKPSSISIEDATDYITNTKEYMDEEGTYYGFYMIFEYFLNNQNISDIKDNDDLYEYAIDMFLLWEDYFDIQYWDYEGNDGIAIYEDLLKKKKHNLTNKNIKELILKLLKIMNNYYHSD